MTIVAGGRRLRCGYTTGSRAAAATKAACRMLFTGVPVEEVSLVTPAGIKLHLLIEEIQIERDAEGKVSRVACAVRKDGGDDIDATHGALVFSTVIRENTSGVRIEGGRGVGRVTRAGLDQPAGEAAINSVPRQMIREAAGEICREEGYDGGLFVEISIPEGEEIAKKTFNPRLGIEGGISVLGTSGIVIPMSEAAIVESIRAEMSMLHAEGGDYLLLTPGNYGEAFAAELPELNTSYETKCSNFVGETLDIAVDLGIKGLLFVAHIGKFIKVSGGIMNTHSQHADARAELMAAAALRAEANTETARKILESNTTEEALDILAAESEQLIAPAMKDVADRAVYYLRNRSRDRLQIGLILFSQTRGELARTETAAELIEKLNAQEKKGEQR